ncbi:ceramidase [Microvirga sp. ACRRW]|uniref:ceramidase domain-containing protein n=1 Tax=Microvirga sp. ACRRW TaxID=2918205 RepID=UPI001EF54E0D|nr:ceramidase domain-containing protein [Microvirga sp. ACRRW]MCG7394738.1 ceramidase [Microvirga sp. ACRRW]
MNPSWFQSIDSYCERLDPSFWAEPVNAVSNGFFLLAAADAFWTWKTKGRSDWPVLWLIIVAAIVGIGSFLFHTFANRWSLLADVLPIAVFIYSYFLLAMRRYLRLKIVPAIAVTLAFVAFNVSFGRLWFGLFPGVGLNGSVGYLPALMALATVGSACLLIGMKQPGRALLWAACVFSLSLFFRSIDSAVCSALPLGTHAFWHMLNALVLWILMNAALVRGSEERLLHVPR